MMRHEASEVRLAAAFATSGEGSSRNRSSVSCEVPGFNATARRTIVARIAGAPDSSDTPSLDSTSRVSEFLFHHTFH
mgnify:CR=1 FL=1